jgi:hypothetical protein
MPYDLFLLSAARALLEVAGFSLLGQGALAFLVGKRRHSNPFYKILAIITAPVLQVVRYIAPRRLRDPFIPPLAFLLLFSLWLLLALAKRMLCLTQIC